jgi:hypothetical protein
MSAWTLQDLLPRVVVDPACGEDGSFINLHEARSERMVYPRGMCMVPTHEVEFIEGERERSMKSMAPEDSRTCAISFAFVLR